MKPCLLEKIEKQEINAKNFGFYWETIDQLIEQIISECHEIQEAHESKNRSHLQEEIGDLMQAAISLAVFCKFDPYETLSKSIDKFQKRYDALVEITHRDGLVNLHNKDFDVLNHYWKMAKKQTYSHD